MIDIRDLRENPEKYRKGAADKNYDVDVARLLEVDKRLRAAMREREELTAEKNRIGKEIGMVAGKNKRVISEQIEKMMNDQARMMNEYVKNITSPMRKMDEHVKKC